MVPVAGPESQNHHAMLHHKQSLTWKSDASLGYNTVTCLVLWHSARRECSFFFPYKCFELFPQPHSSGPGGEKADWVHCSHQSLTEGPDTIFTLGLIKTISYKIIGTIIEPIYIDDFKNIFTLKLYLNLLVLSA